ncbi:hypothetical protein [Haloarchaeobius salinus]|uniref:hypothetical protein n=1 Tax=Haloarchaeobius salinus TaxID=1198298 RepID=UPI00210BF055|nr:hypothetical protein [Haloarchaeobius salinus]
MRGDRGPEELEKHRSERGLVAPDGSLDGRAKGLVRSRGRSAGAIVFDEERTTGLFPRRLEALQEPDRLDRVPDRAEIADDRLRPETPNRLRGSGVIVPALHRR